LKGLTAYGKIKTRFAFGRLWWGAAVAFPSDTSLPCFCDFPQGGTHKGYSGERFSDTFSKYLTHYNTFPAEKVLVGSPRGSAASADASHVRRMKLFRSSCGDTFSPSARGNGSFTLLISPFQAAQPPVDGDGRRGRKTGKIGFFLSIRINKNIRGVITIFLYAQVNFHLTINELTAVRVFDV